MSDIDVFIYFPTLKTNIFWNASFGYCQKAMIS